MRRTSLPISKLILAENCGGSDGNSGITANPALGIASDELVRYGGTSVLAETPEYVIAVAGFPVQLGRGGAEQLQQRLKDGTSLRRKGQDPIAPAKVDFSGNEQAVIVLFHFAQQPPITAEDKQVEFVSSLGRVELRAKFNLKEMVYNGKLDL